VQLLTRKYFWKKLMANSKAILHAVKFGAESRSELVGDQEISAAIESDDHAWIHIDLSSPDARSWLENTSSNLDSIVIDALLADESRPRLLEFDNGILLILRGVNLNDNAVPEDMVSMRLWIDENHIISTRRRPLKVVIDIKNRLLAGKGPKSTGEFVASLIERLLERMEPTFTELDESLDDVEEKVMDEPDSSQRQAITAVRKQAIMFRRYIAPQRDAISALRNADVPWLEQTQKRRLQESLNRIVRYVEDLDTIRERAAIVKDELSSALSDKMNRNLYLLSVIAAIFLPLGFLTGLLGINVGGIPGTDNASAFTIFCVVLIVVVSLQILFFKKMKWF